MSRSLTLPRLGETMEEGRIVRWLKQAGESYRRGDVLLEVETDKTTVEVPALEDGALITILAAEGATVPVDTAIATIAGDASSSQTASQSAAAVPAEAASKTTAPAAQASAIAFRADHGPRASPAARRLARAAGIDLSTVAGTGRQGRVQGWDIPDRRAGGGPGMGLALRRWHDDRPHPRFRRRRARVRPAGAGADGARTTCRRG